MNKYLVIYYAPAEAMATMATAIPEEKEAGMGAWMAWKEQAGDAVVDFGSPLMMNQVCGKDGNFEQSNTEVTGYSIMQGESIDAVKALLSNHPHLQWWDGCKIEVAEFVPMG